ncbi:HEAT repeat domain-containing protein [Halobacteriaceae archaeon SHR40]|uniref:HEAT repeat domain-containing protein n=1 Tax=Halovenus amylolytica TaxID=2500550 RepID=UPI000FE3998E
MASSISAFGYTVPLVVVLVLLALVVGLALVVMFWLTTIWSIYRSVQDTRRDQVRDDLQDELLERMFDPDAEWRPWVSSLSSVERDVVESLLDEYIRELDGQDVDQLQELGRELGIPEHSKRQLGKREEYTRLAALTWLTLLADPESLHATDFEPRTPRERAAVARLRWESDDLDTAVEGISILLDDATTQFTVFGQDTLYRIATEDPQALFQMAATHYDAWSQSLLVQVLTVCEHVGTNVTEEDISWLTAMLEHDDEVVRESAAGALKNIGWRDDLRAGRYTDRLLTDPSPRVRSAVYEMLARWGDDQALSKLTAALEFEENDRARLTGTNALVEHEDELLDRTHRTLGGAWAWSQEHVAYDRAARNETMNT